MRLKVLWCGLLASALLIASASLPSVPWLMGVAAVVLQLVFAYSWPKVVRSQAPWATTVIIAVCSVAASAAAVFMPGDSHMSHGVEAIALGVLLTFISQVLRGADAKGRMTGTVTGISGVVIGVLGSSWAAAGTMPYAFSMTVVTVAGLIGAGLVAMTKLPNRATLLLAPLLAAALGAAATALPLGLHWYQGLALGVTAGVMVAALRALAVASRSTHRLPSILGLANGMVLLSGAAAWYVLELLPSA